MTSQKTTLTIEIKVRRSPLYWPLFVYACILCTLGRPVPDWLVEGLFEFYFGDQVGWLRRRWRKSALARYLDRRALYSQRAALHRVFMRAPVFSGLELWSLRELGRINDQLAATYR